MSGAATPNRATAPPGLHPEPGTGQQRDWTRSTWADHDSEAKHPEAVARSLQWADELAERGDHSDARAWLQMIEAIDDELPETYETLPLLPTDWIAPREGLRLRAAVLILAAAVRQQVQMGTERATAAAIAERRRVARDLHDGLAQDLAFIAAHGTRMAGDLGAEHPLAIAASRALAITRDTIAELSDSALTTAEEALEAVAHELRQRFEIAIAIDCHLDTEPVPDALDHLARIAREAIANAARHGGAENVTVSLSRIGAKIVLRVCDDGCGIERAARAAGDGFGLRSMRERAATLGGYLNHRQRESGGTELEVVLP
jgi:signal transduction histidine kinase